MRKRNLALLAGFSLMLAFLMGCSDAVSSTSSSSSSTHEVLEVNDIAYVQHVRGGFPDPLAGSEQRIDEKGIVHGVSAEGIAWTLRGAGVASGDGTRVTLCAVGDQIGTDNSHPIARAYGARSGTAYDFTPFYQEVAPVIQGFDLRFINQETACGGGTPTGYPVFNAPDEAIDALHQVGFNLVNFCSNHVYDQGIAGVLRTHELFDQYADEMMVAGSYTSQEERDTVHLIERNGMRFAFLAYTYGCNFYGSFEGFPNDYMLCGFDKEAIEREVRRAQKLADVVIVAMHWGSEYNFEPNDQQGEYAEFLADLDVDLVLGSHAHIMQATKYVTGPSGNTVPVVFGLSDFVSGWTLADTHLSGLFSCEFSWGLHGVEVSNLNWAPTIEWSDGGDVYVRFLKDMTPDEVNVSTRVIDVPNGDYYQHYLDLIEACGMDIPVLL